MSDEKPDYYQRLQHKQVQRILDLKNLGIDAKPDQLSRISIDTKGIDKIIKKLKRLNVIDSSNSKGNNP